MCTLLLPGIWLMAATSELIKSQLVFWKDQKTARASIAKTPSGKSRSTGFDWTRTKQHNKLNHNPLVNKTTSKRNSQLEQHASS
jgi:hypothetical protein